jgi:hypothetical protein
MGWEDIMYEFEGVGRGLFAGTIFYSSGKTEENNKRQTK